MNNKLANAGEQLACRQFCESDGCNRPRRDAFGEHESDAAGHDRCLARPGTGFDEDRLVVEADRIAARAIIFENFDGRSLFTSPEPSKFTEPLGCGGKLAFAIGGAGVRGQSEGQFVIRTSRVGLDQRSSVGKACKRCAEISADVGEQSVGVIKAQLALFARGQKRSVDPQCPRPGAL